MLDPTIVQGLQHALTPPPFINPPAIYREWTSDAAFRGEKILEPWMLREERQEAERRATITDYVSRLNGVYRQTPWTEAELADLDRTIAIGEAQIKLRREQIDGIQRQAHATQRELRRMDYSSARVHQRYVDRLTKVQKEHMATFRLLVDAVRDYRDAVDIRSGAEPGFVWKPWRPNAVTARAIADAEAGRLEVVTLDDLRAAILADD